MILAKIMESFSRYFIDFNRLSKPVVDCVKLSLISFFLSMNQFGFKFELVVRFHVRVLDGF